MWRKAGSKNVRSMQVEGMIFSWKHKMGICSCIYIVRAATTSANMTSSRVSISPTGVELNEDLVCQMQRNIWGACSWNPYARPLLLLLIFPKTNRQLMGLRNHIFQSHLQSWDAAALVMSNTSTFFHLAEADSGEGVEHRHQSEPIPWRWGARKKRARMGWKVGGE